MTTTNAPILLAWRKSRDWSQAQVADKLGVTKGAVSQHETRGVRGMGLLEKYAKLYRVSVTRLLAGPKKSKASARIKEKVRLLPVV